MNGGALTLQTISSPLANSLPHYFIVNKHYILVTVIFPGLISALIQQGHKPRKSSKLRYEKARLFAQTGFSEYGKGAEV